MCILIEGQDTIGFRVFSDVTAKPSMNNMAWIKAKIEAHFQCAGVGGDQFLGLRRAEPQAILSRSFAAVGDDSDVTPSPSLVREELAAHGNLDPIAHWILYFANLHRKIDGTHDAITKLLMDQLFDRLSINQSDFVKSID
jgi:hypothetical protein